MWRRILIVGGFILGIAFVALLAFFTSTTLNEDDGEPEPQVAQPSATGTPTPAVTRTPAATPTPTPQLPTPTPAPEPTPEPTEEPPPAAAVEEPPPPPPPTEEPPAPPATEEPPPPPTEQPPPPPTEEPSPLALTAELPSAPQSVYAAACQAWIDAGGSPDDLEGVSACISLLTEVCLAYQSDPSVVGGAEACQAIDILLAYYPQPSGVTEGDIVVETCIDGDFEGWEGETIFVLCNGQVWQQASYDYMYHYAYRPEVLIYRTDSRYRMKVEGVGQTIDVIRLPSDKCAEALYKWAQSSYLSPTAELDIELWCGEPPEVYVKGSTMPISRNKCAEALYEWAQSGFLSPTAEMYVDLWC